MSYCQKKNQNYLNFSDPSQLPSKDYNTHYQNNNFNYINSNQQYVNQYPFQRKHNNEIINEYTNENPHYDKEEPKFQNENERNIHQYLNYVQSKQQLIEKNSKNYLEYIINERKERRTKSPAISIFAACAIPITSNIVSCANKPIKYLPETTCAFVYGIVPLYCIHRLRSSYPMRLIGIIPQSRHG
jgi:hypothetical protein